MRKVLCIYLAGILIDNFLLELKLEPATQIIFDVV